MSKLEISIQNLPHNTDLYILHALLSSTISVTCPHQIDFRYGLSTSYVPTPSRNLMPGQACVVSLRLDPDMSVPDLLITQIMTQLISTLDTYSMSLIGEVHIGLRPEFIFQVVQGARVIQDAIYLELPFTRRLLGE
jgi:hypothetical protein